MVLIFDLDDTLYDEMSYVKSGFLAVSDYCYQSFGWSTNSSYSLMLEHLLNKGRGQVFDELLKSNDSFSRSKVLTLLSIYRNHSPKISLDKNIIKLLDYFSSCFPLYLVTDGNKLVQHKKILTLGIEKYFKSCLITHRYGIQHAKPSLFCFDKIRYMENCSWTEMIYVGDNPSKDFVNLNSAGATTIRVLTGSYSNVIAEPGFDAMHTIDSLSNLSLLLPIIQNSRNKKSVTFESVPRGDMM